MTMQMHNSNITIQCEAALSDLVLQAARDAMPSDPSRFFLDPSFLQRAGIKNQPLIPLLLALLDATQAVSGAICDNAWDDCLPLDKDLAQGLAMQAQHISNDITIAAQT